MKIECVIIGDDSLGESALEDLSTRIALILRRELERNIENNKGNEEK